MTEPLPTVLVPGLLDTPRLYQDQLPAVWRCGPVTVADHTRDDTVAAVARRILAAAPPRFALAGLSLGGYLAFEILRQAAERVARLALLDTSARPDTPEQSERRRSLIALARGGRFDEVPDLLIPAWLHPDHVDDEGLRRVVREMAVETGPEAFVRQQTAIMARPDSRPDLPGIRCPTLVLVGDGDQLTPPEVAGEIAAGIPDARLVVVPGAGHLSTLERPGEVTRALLGWLTDR
jgi:pimeloyl-ACP methyl ester carboxylesterase